MGERDLGPKVSEMADRDEHAPRRAAPLGDAGDIDGTIAEVLPEDAIEDQEDEALAEALRTDRHDVPEDDYVQDDEVRASLDPVVDPEPEVAAEKIDADERAAHPRPKIRRAEPPGPR
ncbi:Hypothetical protein I5071_56780 [Sandaracinus amylolyticus]|nr:Hypothetical protein I5071_56780 [Sandaracinus amylolyticus]